MQIKKILPLSKVIRLNKNNKNMKRHLLFLVGMGMFLIILQPVSSVAQPRLRQGHGPVVKNPLQRISAYNGIIMEQTYNEDFIFDGFYLNTLASVFLVKFAPYFGERIAALGKELTVNGVLKYAPDGVQELELVSVSGKGQTVYVYDRKPVPPGLSPQDNFVKGEGKVKAVNRDEIRGYVLDNGVVLRFPEHVMSQLSSMIQEGTVVEYTGEEKILRQGEVRVRPYRIVNCRTISLNGTPYLVR